MTLYLSIDGDSIDAWLIDARAYQWKCACDSNSQCNRLQWLLSTHFVQKIRVPKRIAWETNPNTYLATKYIIVRMAYINANKHITKKKCNSHIHHWLIALISNIPLIVRMQSKFSIIIFVKMFFEWKYHLLYLRRRCELKIDNTATWSDYGMRNGVATVAHQTITSIKIGIIVCLLFGLLLKANRWGGNYFKLVNWREFCLFIVQNALRITST